MRIPVALVALAFAGTAAEAASIPMPRPRPMAMENAVPLPPARPTMPDGEAKVAEAPPQPSACQLALKTIAAFLPEAPVKGAGQCGIADPVRLEAIILPDQSRVAVNPPALLRCDMATAVSHWVREDMAPAATRLGSALRSVENFDSYDCRGRNRVAGAKMSEHGRGNALDIKAVKLDSGATAHLTDPHVVKAVRDDLRRSACERFRTVLGPGSDGYHENHIHVDLAERRGDYRMCQWDVRKPLDRASPSPHIASSRSPTPLQAMPSGPSGPASDAMPLPRPRRAAERR